MAMGVRAIPQALFDVGTALNKAAEEWEREREDLRALVEELRAEIRALQQRLAERERAE